MPKKVTAAAPGNAHGTPIITRARYVQLVTAAVARPSEKFATYVGTVWDNAGGPGPGGRRVSEIWLGHAMALAELSSVMYALDHEGGVFPGEPEPAARASV